MNLQKPTRIVSRKIRESARGEQCSIRYPGCDGGTDTTVLAHLNSKWKGVGNKSPDIFGVYACHFCHQKLDSGRIPASEQLQALMETQMKLYRKGLIECK
jgi:hypothetical protein